MNLWVRVKATRDLIVGLVPRTSPRRIHRGADEGINPYNLFQGNIEKIGQTLFLFFHPQIKILLADTSKRTL